MFQFLLINTYQGQYVNAYAQIEMRWMISFSMFLSGQRVCFDFINAKVVALLVWGISSINLCVIWLAGVISY